jgi:hypothetical protein
MAHLGAVGAGRRKVVYTTLTGLVEMIEPPKPDQNRIGQPL